jgi:hypothetical protein
MPMKVATCSTAGTVCQRSKRLKIRASASQGWLDHRARRWHERVVHRAANRFLCRQRAEVAAVGPAANTRLLDWAPRRLGCRSSCARCGDVAAFRRRHRNLHHHRRCGDPGTHLRGDRATKHLSDGHFVARTTDSTPHHVEPPDHVAAQRGGTAPSTAGVITTMRAASG